MTAQFIQQDFTRDRWGRPLITPADGGKPVAYTRISGYGSVLENQFGLTKWKLRTLLKGSLDRPDLRAAAEAKLGDDRHLDDIVDRMMEHAGASSAANIGTAIHEILAQLDAGHITLQEMPDNFVRRISDGKLVALDKKTGKQIHARPLAYMVQLYLYATAVRYNVTTGERTQIGDVDTTEALIAHIPAAGDGRCDIYRVDLTAVRPIVELARAVKAVEKGAPQVVKLDTPPAPVDPIDQPASQVRIEWVKDRLKVCLDYSEASATMTRHLWPHDVPGFKAKHHHTDRELNLILTALEAVEREHSLPFPVRDPDAAATEQHAIDLVQAAFPNAKPIDTTPMVPDEIVNDLAEMHRNLTPEATNIVSAIVAEANGAGCRLSLRERPSEQRVAAVLALFACAQFEDATIIRPILTHALPDHDAGASLGKLFGTFTITESRAVENTANAFEAGLLHLEETPTGTITLTATNPTNNQNQENQ